ncbi:MAG: hypothetical protein M3Y17_03960 [Actinomycetota bacterium]|nr:hypothetical protein [Actinomycetota bacterium]
MVGWVARVVVALGAPVGVLPQQSGNYPKTGQAQIAETKLGDWRLIVRRTRLLGAQAELFADWRHHAFASNQTGPLKTVEASIATTPSSSL